MKIRETIERECCKPQDLKPVEGSPSSGRVPEYKFCVYCGAYWRVVAFTDPAGASDWEYRKQPAYWVVLDVKRGEAIARAIKSCE